MLALPGAPAVAAPVADAAANEAAVKVRYDNVRPQTADADGFRSMHFDTGPAPAVVFAPAAGAWDWSGARALKVHVQNAMPWPVTLRITLRDAAGAQLASVVGLPPGPPQTLVIPLQATAPRAWGMVAGPPMPWLRAGERVFVATQVDGRLARERVVSIAFSIPAPDSAQTLRLGKLFTETARDDLRDAYAGIVDAFGQSTRADWPDKVRSLEQLRTLAAQEDRRLAAWLAERPANAITGPAQRPSGFFRTERAPPGSGAARWWLITPEGKRFFSLGVNTVRASGDDTITEGREFMFDGLPGEAPPLAAFRGRRDSRAELPGDSGAQRGRGYGSGRSFDFYRANLWRRDGESYPARWLARTTRRLQGWGFNTIGNWSDPALGALGRMPYVKALKIDGEFARLSDGDDWWGAAPDPFDPRFAQAAALAIAEGTRGLRDDHMLIGFFIDNELAWGNGAANDPRRRYALAASALRQDARLPAADAKRAFIDLLKRRHGSAAALAHAWGLAIGDWNGLLAPLSPALLPNSKHPAIAEDFRAFQALHADAYFRQVAQALKRADPNHLYLGARFSARTPEAVAACARWCDVVSFNLYVPSITTGFEGEAFHALGKPAMLTEFHFGSADRGPFWAGVQPVAGEDDRGPAYAKLLESVLANPDFVGAHWFQYLDEPVTGRWLDGENGHLGLVAITDLPWSGFIERVRAANHDLMRQLGTLR